MRTVKHFNSFVVGLTLLTINRLVVYSTFYSLLQKHYKCKLCDIELPGMVDVNFLSNGQSHFRAKHRDNFDSFLASLENGQMRISGTGIMVNLEQKSAKK